MCGAMRYDRNEGRSNHHGQCQSWCSTGRAHLPGTHISPRNERDACGRQGTSDMHPWVSHYLICILMVERILLLALRSLRKAVLW